MARRQGRLEEHVSPLVPAPPRSQRLVLDKLTSCSQADLLLHLQNFQGQHWERCTAVHWHPVLNRFDGVLAAFAEASQKRSAATADGAPTVALVLQVLRVLCEVIFLYPELKGAFASGERLKDLLILDCPDLPVSVILATLRCLSVSQHGRQLRGPPGSPAELRLEALASGLGWPGGLRAACLSECPARDFSFELPRVLDESSSSCLTVLSLPAGADRSPEALLQELIEAHSVPSSHHPALRLQLSLWCHARSTQGRREVVAIALYALCNTMRHLGPFSLQQLFLQKWPGLFAELCDLLQCLQLVGPDVGVAALRAAGALLDSRYGQSRAETSQLSQMLGLAMPHGILANALRGLLSGPPVQGRPAEQHQVLIAALDLFQVTTAANHQSTIQLGNAGMVMSMLELLQQTDVASLPAVMAMLRCLELASEVSSATALVLFREFHGLQAFSTRLQKELELLLALSFQGDVHNAEPPAEAAPEAERAAHWDLLLEVTARRRLCRQFLKNIQVALHCSEVVQAGLANVFQGPLMEVLKKAFEEPQKVGLCLFGSSVDIVSNLIQDDPSRVPQMIESGLLPGIFASLSRDTLRSVECLTFIPGVLGAISLHAAGEDFILKSSAKPLKLLVDIQLDPSFAPLLHSQPELIQIISTHVDKVIRNRPTGSMLLTEHVVECLVEALRSVIESSKAYPDWDPTELEDRTDALADRLAAFGRFCWSVLGGGGDTAKLFSEKQGFALVREAMELRCLPFQLCSLEGQQHPLGSLFGVQASRPNPGANPGAPIAVPDVSPVLKLLQDMLSSHHGQTMAFVTARVPLLGSTDPYEALAACPVNEVMGFLRSLSGAMTALEGLLSVCREGSSGLPLESLTEPLNMVQELAPLIFRLSAWRAKDKDPKASQIGTYAELVSSVFGEGRQALGNRPTPITVEAEQPRSGESQVQAEQRRIFAAALAPAGPATSPATDRSAGMEVDAGGSSSSKAKDSSSMKTPLARASRQCFRLAARTLRQLLVLASKQLQNRARIRDMMPAAVTLSRQLSQVSKAVLSIERPAEPAAALRWVGDSFELLLKMHEEQNKVAVRPTCICSFYQDAGFELLGPLLQFASQGLGQGSTDHQHLASIAFSGAVGYFEKVTSFKRFSNALQFRTEDGLIPKDDLCRSVQAQALKCVLPVWHQSDLSLVPKAACGSLMKVFLHPLQEKAASEVPLLPPREARGMSVVPHPAAAFLQSFGLAPTAAQPRAAPPPPPSAVAPAAVAADAAPSALLLGTLVEMGFTREQVEAAVQQLTPLGGGGDVGQLIQRMVHNQLQEAPATPAVAGAASGATASKGLSSDLAPVSLDEFKALVNDMLQDLRARVLLCGRQVPKAVPIVAETMCFLVGVSTALWPTTPPGDDPAQGSKENAEAVVAACVAELGDSQDVPDIAILTCVTQVLANLFHRKPQTLASLGNAGSVMLLEKLQRWSMKSIDFSISPADRGYRLLIAGSAAPAPAGVGKPLLAAPIGYAVSEVWLTPDLVKLCESREALAPEVQQKWVSGVLDLIYAFPGMDAGMAQSCVQILTRLCSTPAGAKAFLQFQPQSLCLLQLVLFSIFWLLVVLVICCFFLCFDFLLLLFYFFWGPKYI
ncbi:unnamed protein product [Polarella glacialis]|uniref:HECT-type E3 ubiquitin transferase n=1 Tax=Polarella glacialis TaxID=89957 RepID=A0A813JJE7_POLGL|nr:unnamed protein product [Polarella glacialis]